MCCELRHEKLQVTFQGIRDNRFGAEVVHFRGIPYGSIERRFAAPKAAPAWKQNDFDATTFGPKCPQPEIDVGHLLRSPEKAKGPVIETDEFQCLNMNVTCPVVDVSNDALPVVIWIHGGSQVVTFASASDPVCDPTRIVAQSILGRKPLIFVTFNYRLNIFAFGDGSGESNLALKDQRLLIDWVSQNISEVGGDPRNVTLAGESAGAVYTHAHLITGAPVKRAILASGSLHLSPPLPKAIGAGLVQRLSDAVMVREEKSLRNAHASTLVAALDDLKINSMWLQEDDGLRDWITRGETVKEIMIGDLEFESVIWRSGIEAMESSEIWDSFSAAGSYADELRTLYHINPDRPAQSKHGALDFLNDARFGLPVIEITERNLLRERKIYPYLIDQTNPWQASSRSHHGVDLILLFGGVDLSFNPAAERVGYVMREKWISFANGEEPWISGEAFAFGPYGKCSLISKNEHESRRRLKSFERLRDIGLSNYNAVVGKLAAGRISLLN